MLRLGAINFINSLPFFLAFEKGVIVCPSKRVYAVPSALNRMLYAGELDVSPISAAEYIEHKSSYVLLPDYCIGAAGPVHSVALFSRHPIEELDGKTIALSPQSASSNLLTQILCQHYWNITPTFTTTGDSKDAIVKIGDQCLQHEPQTGMIKIDLAEAWLEATGLPFTFAVFAARQEVAEKSPQALKELMARIGDALDWADKNHNQVIASAQARCPQTVVHYIDYYKALKFRLTSDQLKGLDLFMQLSSSLTSEVHS